MTAILPLSSKKLVPLFVSLFSAALLSACASQSGDTALESTNTIAAETSATEAAADERPIICRNERQTGTNFRQRICLSAEGWKALQRAERRIVTEVARQTAERSGQAAAQQSNVGAGGGI